MEEHYSFFKLEEDSRRGCVVVGPIVVLRKRESQHVRWWRAYAVQGG